MLNTKSRMILQLLGQIVLLTLILSAVSGCQRRINYDAPVYARFQNEGDEIWQNDRFKTASIVDQIDRYYRGNSNGPLGVSTLVSLDDLYSSSTFGRMFAEQMMTQLSMRGFDVIELRHADALHFVSHGGEFALSRDVSMVRSARDLAGVIVGTYVASPLRVYVNVRLVDPSSSMVLAGGTVEMPKTQEMAKLLRGGSLPGSLERIPVRHLNQRAFPIALFNQASDPAESIYAHSAEPPPYQQPLAPEAKLVDPAPAPESKATEESLLELKVK